VEKSWGAAPLVLFDGPMHASKGEMGEVSMAETP
jgi:hypothetical protein